MLSLSPVAVKMQHVLVQDYPNLFPGALDPTEMMKGSKALLIIFMFGGVVI